MITLAIRLLALAIASGSLVVALWINRRLDRTNRELCLLLEAATHARCAHCGHYVMERVIDGEATDIHTEPGQPSRHHRWLHLPRHRQLPR